MKKIKTTLIITMVPLIALGFMNLLPRVSGSPGGKSGSPGDNSQTCTQCHAGTATEKAGWISTDIPDDGYSAGEVYTITLTAEQSGISKFGFELTAEDGTNAKVGIYDIQGSNEIKLTNSNSAVTHTSSGTTGNEGTKVWSFKWTAPASGTGEVDFYAAVNAANSDGGSGGDKIYKTSLKVPELIDNSIESFLLEGWLKVFPNPANSYIRLHMNGVTPQDLDYGIYDIRGKLIRTGKHQVISSNSIVSLDITDLSAGNYILHFKGNGVNLKGKFLVLGD